MIKKTIYFGNPVYLSLKNAQLVIKLPEIAKNDSLPDSFRQQSQVTKPIEDIGVVVLDNRQITITSGALEALLENNCAIITCDSKSMPVGLMLPLYGNTTQKRAFPPTTICLRPADETTLATNHQGKNQQPSRPIGHLHGRRK